ncbi:MAG: corrinoid protein-associated methyltransferase CpaM [Promethearchaeota archaeon]
MSYVYMKALENKATKYDKGIKLLTLGTLPKIKKFIVDQYITPSDHILDIGMGTGTFAILSASKKKTDVIGIDRSEKMLAIATNHINKAGFQELVHPKHLNIVEMDTEFPDCIFDKVIAILSISEMYINERAFCLKQISRVLKPEGEFIIVDEMIPRKIWQKLLYYAIRIPLVFLTYIITNLSTKSLEDIYELLEDYNFRILEERSYLLDSLRLIRVKKN